MKPAQWRRSKGWACTCFGCTSPQFNGIESMPVRRATADAIGDLVAEAQEDSFWDWAEAEEADAVQWYEDGILAEGLPAGVASDDASHFHVGNE